MEECDTLLWCNPVILVHDVALPPILHGELFYALYDPQPAGKPSSTYIVLVIQGNRLECICQWCGRGRSVSISSLA